MPIHKIVQELNLNSPDNWFELWHTHVDWDGEGNSNWESRKPFIDELLTIFKDLKKELSHFSQPYQLWILIHEQDSAQDAVYLHTQNPNTDNFPITLAASRVSSVQNEKLKTYIHSLDLEVLPLIYDRRLLYYLTDQQAGLALTEEARMRKA